MIKRPESQERFFREASKLLSLQPHDFFNLIDMIQAPPNLKSFFCLLPNLPDILQSCVAICEVSENLPDHLCAAGRTASTLRSLLPQLENNSNLHDLQPTLTARYGPFTDVLETHPLYSFLGVGVGRKDLSKRYILLQAQVLLAMEALGRPEGKLLQTLLTPFRRLRELASLINWPVLEKLPDQIVSTEAIPHLLNRKLLNTDFAPICRIFSLAKAGFQPGKKKPATPKEKTFRPPLVKLEEDQNRIDAYLRDVLPSTILSQTEANEYAEQGGLPQDLGPNTDQELVQPQDKYHGPTLRQMALQAKQASNHRALLNQFSPQAWNQANLFDLQVLLDFIEGTRSLPEVEFAPLDRDETAVLLGLVLFTCNSFDRLLSLPVFPADHPRFNSPEGLYWRSGDAPLVRLHSPGPKLAGRWASKETIPVEQHVHLPLPPFLLTNLKATCQKLWGNTTRAHLLSRIDPQNSDIISTVYDQIIKVFYTLNRTTGSRLSLNRISTYLLHRVSAEKQCDLPSASLFFGREDKILETRIHYTLAPARLLEAAFRRCCNQLLEATGRKATLPAEETVNANSFLGTPFCPTQTTVRRIAQELQDAVNFSVKSSMRHRHNIFTLYTAMLIAFGTGFRAIKDPSLSEVEIDFDYGLGVVVDKGDERYRSRYVYLAPVVLEQMNYYRQHMQVLYSHLGVRNPSLFNLVKHLDFEGLPMTLFWLQEDEEPVEILAPKALRPLLDRNFSYTVPLNANRHYLKYHLLMDGCSPELVEAQMGHWENGQEPWSIQSNLDPLDFVQQMAKHLPGILAKDGWRAVPGLSA